MSSIPTLCQNHRDVADCQPPAKAPAQTRTNVANRALFELMIQVMTKVSLETLTKLCLWLGLIMIQLRAGSKGSLRLMVLSSGFQIKVQNWE
ncbi:hypothetical protein ACS0TY_028588 [Phlomoides rotata]